MPVSTDAGVHALSLPVVAVLISVFAASLLLFISAWDRNPAIPRAGSEGYRAWYDQSSYLQESRILASRHLPGPGLYVYGLGYPAVAIPSLALSFERDPYMPFDALAFAATLTMATAIGARVRGLTFGVAASALLAFGTPLLDLTDVPWNSTVTLLSVTFTLLLTVSAWRASLLAAAAVGVAVGWSFAARYVDGLFPLLMTLGTAFRSWRQLLILSAVAGTIIGGVLWTHARTYGSPFRTPYSIHMEANGAGHSDQDLAAYNLSAVPGRFVGVMTGFDNGARLPGEPLGERFFWVALAPIGAWMLVKDRHPLRLQFTVASFVSIISLVFYLSFRASGAGMLRFGGLHYFKAMFPLWAVLAAYGGLRLLEVAQVRSPGRPSSFASTKGDSENRTNDDSAA